MKNNNWIIVVLAWLCVFVIFALLIDMPTFEQPRKKPEIKIEDEKLPTQLSLQSFKKDFWPWIKARECGPFIRCCVTLKDDPGGYTCFGVATRDNPAYHMLLSEHKDIIKTKQKELIAITVMYSSYYKNPKISHLPRKWQLAVLDFAIHSGPKTAVKQLQLLLGIKADGVIGSTTVDRLKQFGSGYDQVEQYIELRRSYIKRLRNYSTHKRGWNIRLDQLEDFYEKIS